VSLLLSYRPLTVRPPARARAREQFAERAGHSCHSCANAQRELVVGAL